MDVSQEDPFTAVTAEVVVSIDTQCGISDVEDASNGVSGSAVVRRLTVVSSALDCSCTWFGYICNVSGTIVETIVSETGETLDKVADGFVQLAPGLLGVVQGFAADATFLVF